MDSGITVTGTGQASAPADLLRLFLSVGHDAQDVATAVEAVAARTDAVTAALREAGVAAGDIRTSSVNVYPHYSESMRVAGYRASHSLTLRTTDLAGFGRLLKVAIDAAGNDLGVDQLSFDVADKSALLEQARQSAFADACAKAAHLAGLAGMRLGRIDAITETFDHAPIVPLMARESSAAAPTLAVTPGEHTVDAAVTVRWTWA
jgi:uncharacterized protein YggE